MVFDITMRVSKHGESKSATIGVAVTPTEKTALEALADSTERSLSYWVGKFMRDGWAIYSAETGGEGADEAGGGRGGGKKGQSIVRTSMTGKSDKKSRAS